METDKVNELCRPHTFECCSYLAADEKGWCCLKTTTAKSIIDKRRALGTMKAKGDNCPGYDNVTEEYLK